MRNATLRIRKDGADITYKNDQLLVGPIKVESRIDGLQTEVSDLTVEVFGEFLGWTSLSDIEHGTYRAQLLVDFEVVFDGVIVTSDLQRDERSASWIVRLTTNATKEFASLQETIEAGGGEFDDGVSYTKIDCVFNVDPSELRREIALTRVGVTLQQFETVAVLWNDPVELLDYVLDTLGVTYEHPPAIPVDCHPSVPADDDLYMTRGNGDCVAIVDAIQALAGWRRDVRYQTYPSAGIHVAFRPIDEASGPPLSTFTAYDAPVASVDDESKWYVKVGSDEASVQADSIDLRGLSETYKIGAPIPAVGQYAMTAWDFEPPGKKRTVTIDGAQDIETTDPRRPIIDGDDLPYRHPAVHVDEHVIRTHSDGHNEAVACGAPYLSDTELYEDILVIAATAPDSVGFSKAIHSVSIVDVGFDVSFYSPAWARVPFQNRISDHAVLGVTNGEYEGHVGLDTPLTEIPRRSTYDVDDNATRLESVQILVPSVDVAPSGGAVPSSPWKVIQPGGRLHKTEHTGSVEWYIQAWWKSTVQQYRAEVWYNADVLVEDDNGNKLTQEAWPRGNTNLFYKNRIYATSFSVLSSVGGNGLSAETVGGNIIQYLGDMQVTIWPVYPDPQPGGTRGDPVTVPIFRDASL